MHVEGEESLHKDAENPVAPGAMHVEDEESLHKDVENPDDVPYKRQGPRCLTTFQSFLLTGILVACATLISVTAVLQLLKTGANGACFSASRLMSTVVWQSRQMFPNMEELVGLPGQNQVLYRVPYSLFGGYAWLRWGDEVDAAVENHNSTMFYAYGTGVDDCGRNYNYLLTPWGFPPRVERQVCFPSVRLFRLVYIASEGFELDGPITMLHIGPIAEGFKLKGIYESELKREGGSRKLILHDCLTEELRCDDFKKQRDDVKANFRGSFAEIRGLLHCGGPDVTIRYHFQYFVSPIY